MNNKCCGNCEFWDEDLIEDRDGVAYSSCDEPLYTSKVGIDIKDLEFVPVVNCCDKYKAQGI